MITRIETPTRAARPAIAPLAVLGKSVPAGVDADSEDFKPGRVATVTTEFVAILAPVAAGIFAFSSFVASSNMSRSMPLPAQVRETPATDSAAV
jgi:hypothetical protein